MSTARIAGGLPRSAHITPLATVFLHPLPPPAHYLNTLHTPPPMAQHDDPELWHAIHRLSSLIEGMQGGGVEVDGGMGEMGIPMDFGGTWLRKAKGDYKTHENWEDNKMGADDFHKDWSIPDNAKTRKAKKAILDKLEEYTKIIKREITVWESHCDLHLSEVEGYAKQKK